MSCESAAVKADRLPVCKPAQKRILKGNNVIRKFHLVVVLLFLPDQPQARVWLDGRVGKVVTISTDTCWNGFHFNEI